MNHGQSSQLVEPGSNAWTGFPGSPPTTNSMSEVAAESQWSSLLTNARKVEERVFARAAERNARSALGHAFIISAGMVVAYVLFYAGW